MNGQEVETPAAGAEHGDVDVRTPDFTAVQPTGARGPASTLNSVYDVSITITAELGRLSVPIAELLQLGEGSVVELGRPVSSPVDIRAQGVLLARGEVVVVDDCFAVRLKEIMEEDVSAGSHEETPA